MTNRLEIESERWRQKGYLTVADLLDKAREEAIKQKAPAEFPSEHILRNQLDDTRVAVARGLYIEDGKNLKLWSPEVIIHFNTTAGASFSSLPERMKLKDIIIDNQHRRALKRSGEDFANLDVKLLGQYNRAIRIAAREFYYVDTLQKNADDIWNTKGLGDLNGRFLYWAFQPPHIFERYTSTL